MTNGKRRREAKEREKEIARELTQLREMGRARAYVRELRSRPVKAGQR